jgi:collagen type III alpha
MQHEPGAPNQGRRPWGSGPSGRGCGCPRGKRVIFMECQGSWRRGSGVPAEARSGICTPLVICGGRSGPRRRGSPAGPATRSGPPPAAGRPGRAGSGRRRGSVPRAEAEVPPEDRSPKGSRGVWKASGSGVPAEAFHAAPPPCHSIPGPACPRRRRILGHGRSASTASPPPRPARRRHPGIRGGPSTSSGPPGSWPGTRGFPPRAAPATGRPCPPSQGAAVPAPPGIGEAKS